MFLCLLLITDVFRMPRTESFPPSSSPTGLTKQSIHSISVKLSMRYCTQAIPSMRYCTQAMPSSDYKIARLVWLQFFCCCSVTKDHQYQTILDNIETISVKLSMWYTLCNTSNAI